MQKKWLIHQVPDKEMVAALAASLKVPELIGRLLVRRGVTNYNEAEAFFRPKLDQLHDPFLMQHMDLAVTRLNKAIETKERVLVYGDYDVDGTTSAALMHSYLQFNKLDSSIYIPDRYKEGYGISQIGIEFANKNKYSLIIALDCGINALDQAALAKKLGIDLIICDHHTPGEQLPDAIILNPKLKTCKYPFKELSGCGVGFKLLQALNQFNNWSDDWLLNQLDLLAISIGADIVSVTGENRILAFNGLKRMNQKQRKGINAVLQIANKPFPLNLSDVVFTLAPRINAAGRMDDAKNATSLILAETESEATQFAQKIEAFNLNRKNVDEATNLEAIEIVKTSNYRNANLVFKKNWHKGVLGIVASRLIEFRHRPTIVLTCADDENVISGSVRSVDGINVHAVLMQCAHLLEKFGGHYFAAGLSIKPANLHEFFQYFDAQIGALTNQKELVPTEHIDEEVKLIDFFSNGELPSKIPKICRILNQFQPFGPGNMKPVFLTKNCFVSEASVLKEKHLKLVVYQPDFPNLRLSCIGFNLAEKYDYCSEIEPIEIIYTMGQNNWNNNHILQLELKDLRRAKNNH
jgi:single-stranded-DNA-specific exonuclease